MLSMVIVKLAIHLCIFQLVNCECWKSGCQLSFWGERGCFPSETWSISGPPEPCENGEIFHCCRREDVNDSLATTTEKIEISEGSTESEKKTIDILELESNNTKKSEALITWDEFVKALKLNNFPTPKRNQYDAMIKQHLTKGRISTKRELAMFVAQILWESGGLQFKKELICIKTSCPGIYDNKVGLPDKSYYGRGYIQLTHSYNYKAASLSLYKDMRLIENPDLVSDNEQVNWAVSFWFWKQNVHRKPGVSEGQFGATTKAINGALECKNERNHDKAKKRFQMYKNVLIAFGLDEKPNEKGCYN